MKRSGVRVYVLQVNLPQHVLFIMMLPNVSALEVIFQLYKW